MRVQLSDVLLVSYQVQAVGRPLRDINLHSDLWSRALSLSLRYHSLVWGRGLLSGDRFNLWSIKSLITIQGLDSEAFLFSLKDLVRTGEEARTFLFPEVFDIPKSGQVQDLVAGVLKDNNVEDIFHVNLVASNGSINDSSSQLFAVIKDELIPTRLSDNGHNFPSKQNKIQWSDRCD